MSLIISKHHQPAVCLNPVSFQREDDLQTYISKHPESIPVGDIKDQARLLILARELSTNSGPIDAIGIDQDGELYVVETKLYKNQDKRTVLAQILDYGAAMWKHTNDFENFLYVLTEHTQKLFSCGLEEKIEAFFHLTEEEIQPILSRMKTDLDLGRFHFIVLMDQVDDRLKDLIAYMNQSSQFTIYAVELEHYTHEGYDILIPKIFGAESKKQLRFASHNRSLWDKETFWQDAKTKLTTQELNACEELYRFAENHGAEIRFGNGAFASFSVVFPQVASKNLLTFTTDKRLSFNFDWIAKENPQAAQTFLEKLNDIEFSFPDDALSKRPSVKEDEWLPRMKGILNILEAMLSK